MLDFGPVFKVTDLLRTMKICYMSCCNSGVVNFYFDNRSGFENVISDKILHCLKSVSLHSIVTRH